jgi:hypothetical protein
MKMKKIILVLAIMFVADFVQAQVLNVYPVVCFIQYKYDKAGNRIERNYRCDENSNYDSGEIHPDPNGHQNNASKPSNTQEKLTEGTIIFPNPTSGIFYVKLPAHQSECVIEIRDESSRLLQTLHLTSFEKGINISQYANGQYYINIFTGDKHELLKLTKNE